VTLNDPGRVSETVSAPKQLTTITASMFSPQRVEPLVTAVFDVVIFRGFERPCQCQVLQFTGIILFQSLTTRFEKKLLLISSLAACCLMFYGSAQSM
jgi:hypothetical protein